MRILGRDERSEKNTSVALGIFDGVHLGHREILSSAESFSDERTDFGVFTFGTQSVKKKHGMPYEYIYTQSQKELLLEEAGAQLIFSPEIDELMDMSGEEFAKRILRDKLRAVSVSCGESFRFGRGALCGVNELEELGKRYGFRVRLCPTVFDKNKKISSGSIKESLKKGDMDTVNRLLGENYFINARVVTGKKLGRTISFPTINQPFSQRQTLPRFGAYASSCETDGKIYRAVTDIGVKPTVSSNGTPLAETYISGFSGDLYGRTVRVSVLSFLRPETKFPSIEKLKEQIRIDVERAKSI